MKVVVQHPALDGAVIEAFAKLLDGSPDEIEPTHAIWRGMEIRRERVRALGDALSVDADVVPDELRLSAFRLVTFDMDSTLITVECIDEIADFAGRQAEVAAITEATMRGEIADFAESLRRRVACLAGVPFSALQRVLDERVRLSPGAQHLLEQLRAAGLSTLLVSGGFTFFTESLRERLAFDHARANRLEVIDGRLSGRVVGPIVDAAFKRAEVERCCAALGVAPSAAIVVGDGANDLEMMAIAGLSVAWRAKPVVQARADIALEHCALDALLNFFEGR